MSRELSRSLLINTLWSFIGRFGYLGVSLVTNIILVRLLSPKEFGQVGIMMFFIIVANVLTESGLSGALVRKQNATEVDYSTIFIFNLVVSVVLMALLIFSSGYIANFYGDPQIKNILMVSSIVLLINALKITQNTRLIKQLQFKRKAVYEFVAVIVASAIAVFLAYKGAGVWALVALQVFTAAILAVLLWALVGPLKCYTFSKRSFKEFYKFGVNTTFASLLNTAFDNVYQLILGKYFSITQAGYFYQAKKLQEMPLQVLKSTMLGVIYSTLSKLQNSPKEFNAFYQNVVKIFTIIVALICVLLFYYADVAINLLYGDKWETSVFYLQLLSIASFFYLQEMFNRIIFKIFDRTELILRLEIIKKIIQSITIMYGIWAMSIESLLYGFVATSILSFIINYYYARKVQGWFKIKDLVDLLTVILVAVMTVIFCQVLEGYIKMNSLYTLLLLPFLLLFYVAALQAFKVISFRNDMQNFKKLITGGNNSV